jgi:hypothetical protein
MEISAVAIGADPGAHIRSNEPSALAPCVIERRDNPAAAAARAEEAAMPKENQNAAGGDAEAVRGAGQASGTTQTTEATTASEARGQQPDVQAAAREAVEAERKRAGDIRALCKRHGLSDTFTEGLVNDGSSIEKARNAVLDELAKRDADMGRTYEPAPAQARGTGERDVAYRDAVTSSLLHRHNPGLHQLAEDGREFRGMDAARAGAFGSRAARHQHARHVEDGSSRVGIPDARRHRLSLDQRLPGDPCQCGKQDPARGLRVDAADIHRMGAAARLLPTSSQ